LRKHKERAQWEKLIYIVGYY